MRFPERWASPLTVGMESFEIPDQPFTLAQARGHGITDHRLRCLLNDKRVRRVVRGVFAPTTLADSVAVRCAALSLVVPRYQIVCDRTAAWLHEIDVFGLTDKVALPPTEVCTLRGKAVTELHGVDGRTRDLAESDLMTLGGVRLTTPLRTALDLGCGLGKHRALGAIDQFMRHHGVTQWEMRQQLPRFRRRRGVIQLRSLIPLADPRAESMRESWVRLDIHLAGFPAPVPQYRILHRGLYLYRLDLAWPEHRVAVEYDGEEWHFWTDEQRANDEIRREWLRRHGWTVIVVDKHGIHDPSERWLAELADALSPRTRRLRWASSY